MATEHAVSQEQLENAPDALVTFDASGEVAWANHAAAALFGYPLDSFIDLPMERLIPERLRSAHAEHHARYRSRPKASFMGHRPYDLLALRRDGTEFLAEISLGPSGEGDTLSVLAVVRDITPRRAQQLENENIRLALDSVAEAVFLFDSRSFEIWYANEGATKQTGIARGDSLLERSFLSMFTPTVDTPVVEILGPLASGERGLVAFDALCQRPDGFELNVEVLVQRATSVAFGRDSYIALSRDTTTRKRHAQALAHEVEQRHQRESQLDLADERERIARRLQDSVIQRLFAVGIRLQGAGDDMDRLKAAADAAVAEIDGCIAEVRDTIFTIKDR